jgi:hypothetical protein
MMTLELAWLELWLEATTAQRAPAPDERPRGAEAAGAANGNSALPGAARRWLRHMRFSPRLRSDQAPAHEPLDR